MMVITESSALTLAEFGMASCMYHGWLYWRNRTIYNIQCTCINNCFVKCILTCFSVGNFAVASFDFSTSCSLRSTLSSSVSFSSLSPPSVSFDEAGSDNMASSTLVSSLLLDSVTAPLGAASMSGLISNSRMTYIHRQQ